MKSSMFCLFFDLPLRLSRPVPELSYQVDTCRSAPREADFSHAACRTCIAGLIWKLLAPALIRRGACIRRPEGNGSHDNQSLRTTCMARSAEEWQHETGLGGIAAKHSIVAVHFTRHPSIFSLLTIGLQAIRIRG